MANHVLVIASFLAIACAIVTASDPGQLQDFCVADPSSKVIVNGQVCKDPSKVTAEDFSFSGLDIAGNTSNQLGLAVTAVFTQQIPGLNTLAIGYVRFDFAPGGLIAPHLHPRASEILTLLEGTLYVGFVTSNPNNTFISKVLQKGDVFVFPQGLIHFQANTGSTNAVALSALSSQNPGTVIIPNAVFGSTPPFPEDVLAKAFQVDNYVVKQLKAPFQKI